MCFDWKYVKSESQATAKHKWNKLTFDPNTKSLSDFLEKFNECAEREFGDNAKKIDSLLNSNLLPHLKRSFNLTCLEKSTYDQIVAHLEKELELCGFQNDAEMSITTMSTVSPIDNQQDIDQTKIVRHYYKKKPGHAIRDSIKGFKRNRSEKMTLRSKTENLQQLDHLHPVLIDNEQIILQRNAGAIPIPLIDPNGSNKTIQQTIGMKGKSKQFCPIQDLYQFSKTLQTTKATTLMDRLRLSETICYIWHNHHSIPLSYIFDHRNFIRCPAATNGKGLYSKI